MIVVEEVPTEISELVSRVVPQIRQIIGDWTAVIGDWTADEVLIVGEEEETVTLGLLRRHDTQAFLADVWPKLRPEQRHYLCSATQDGCVPVLVRAFCRQLPGQRQSQEWIGLNFINLAELMP